jgi:hypothetical protein
MFPIMGNVLTLIQSFPFMGKALLSESYYNYILLLKYRKLRGVSHASRLFTLPQQGLDHVVCETVKDLYCQSINTKACGASFVYKLSHSHDLNLSRHTTLQIASAAIILNTLIPNDI